MSIAQPEFKYLCFFHRIFFPIKSTLNNENKINKSFEAKFVLKKKIEFTREY
jgi:hypothetical protein